MAPQARRRGSVERRRSIDRWRGQAARPGGRLGRWLEAQAHPTASATGSLGPALDLDVVLAVGLLEVDPDDLLAARRDVLADVVGPDRQLAMAAVDEDRQADRARTAEVDERVHRRADRPAGVQDVVDEDDRRVVEVERQVGALDDRLGGHEREVVPVERDVERPDRQADALVLLDRIAQPTGERHAAPLDADEGQSVGAAVLLDQLVGDAHDRPADLVRGHDAAAGHRDAAGIGRQPGAMRRTLWLLLPGLAGPVVKGSAEGYRAPGLLVPGLSGGCPGGSVDRRR